MDFANNVTIGRPVHAVFAFLADFENIPKWNYAIVETHKTSEGAVGVGTTYRQIRSVPSRSEESFEVTEFEPDRKLAIRGTIGPLEGTLAYELEPAGDGTRLINTAHLQASGLGKLVAPIATGRIRDAVAANLAVLKDVLES
jgi:carbon monoxide dehydrogenase subunit G